MMVLKGLFIIKYFLSKKGWLIAYFSPSFNQMNTQYATLAVTVLVTPKYSNRFEFGLSN
jgi:hypothetical protein